MQFVPEDAVYTYFRYDDKQTVMIVMNTGKEERTIETKRFEERFKGFGNAKNIVDGSVKNLNGTWKLPPQTIWIMELNAP